MKIITIEEIKKLLKENNRTEKELKKFLAGGTTRTKKGFFLWDMERFFGKDLEDRAIDN